MDIEEKLTDMGIKLDAIIAHLGIKPNMDFEITNLEKLLDIWRKKTSLSPATAKEREKTIREYCKSANNFMSEKTVIPYLNSSKSDIEYNRRLKALRPFLRDYMDIGDWITKFNFKQITHKQHTSKLPDNATLRKLAHALKTKEALQVFLLTFCSGLRVSEVLNLTSAIIDYSSRIMDCREIHTGETKQAWFSFFTKETANFLLDFENFTITYQEFYSEWSNACHAVGITLQIKDLRLLFAEKCESVGIESKYINAMQGRLSRDIRSKHYTDYNPRKLLGIYDKVEPLLTLGL